MVEGQVEALSAHRVAIQLILRLIMNLRGEYKCSLPPDKMTKLQKLFEAVEWVVDFMIVVEKDQELCMEAGEMCLFKAQVCTRSYVSP